MAEPMTLTAGGIIALLVNALIMGIREWRKSRTGKKNGSTLGDIKEMVENTDKKTDCIDKRTTKIDKSMGIIQTDVKNMQTNCKTTVDRFTMEINSNRDRIFEMAKNKGK